MRIAALVGFSTFILVGCGGSVGSGGVVEATTFTATKFAPQFTIEGYSNDGEVVGVTAGNVAVYATEPAFTPTSLPSFPGAQITIARCVNALGVIAGNAQTGSVVTPIVWPNPTAVPIALPNPLKDTAIRVTGINRGGAIVGVSGTSLYFWASSTSTPVVLYSSQDINLSPAAINDQGTVSVDVGLTSDNLKQALVFPQTAPSGISLLDSLDSTQTAVFGFGPQGRVYGTDSKGEPVYWNQNQYSTPVLLTPFRNSLYFGAQAGTGENLLVNDNGQIAGALTGPSEEVFMAIWNTATSQPIDIAVATKLASPGQTLNLQPVAYFDDGSAIIKDTQGANFWIIRPN